MDGLEQASLLVIPMVNHATRLRRVGVGPYPSIGKPSCHLQGGEKTLDFMYVMVHYAGTNLL